MAAGGRTGWRPVMNQGVRIEQTQLQVEWERARDDAGLERRACMLILVEGRMPDGAAEAG